MRLVNPYHSTHPGGTQINATKQTLACCPRCQSDTEIVVLGRAGDLTLVECHWCLTLQVARLPQAEQQSKTRPLLISDAVA
ncbi:MAG: hypothetical protein ABI614_15275 [Planctomycetota bacterium]